MKSTQARDTAKSTDPENVTCDRHFDDFSELFVVSHCVYLVLKKKKTERKTLAGRAYNKYTVWR